MYSVENKKDCRMIENLKDAFDALHELNYKCELDGEILRCNITEKGQVTININEMNRMNFVYFVSSLGKISWGMDEILPMLLDYNTRISPFAFGIITAVDDASFEVLDTATIPVVLIDSIPLGDLSVEELVKELDALKTALVHCAPVIREIVNSNVGINL
jgi:hypothetical protein